MKIASARDKRVLIIDSQALGKGYLRIPLLQIGFEHIDFVHSTLDADIALSRTHYDLVICSYSLDTEQDGFYYYAHLKQSKRLKAITSFVFISSQSNFDVIQSVIELPPDDFIVKPFTPIDLSNRLARVLKRKSFLSQVHEFIRQNKLNSALTELERVIETSTSKELIPLALKAKGDLLLMKKEYPQAAQFFESVLKLNQFAWAEIGLVTCLLHFGNDVDAERMIINMATKIDTKTMAYELLTRLQLKHECFEEALESAIIACQNSPKNIERQQVARMIAKLAHDHEAEFTIAQRIVRFVRGSVNEAPQHYLNAVRAGIDFAMSSDDNAMHEIINASKKYIVELKNRFPKVDYFQEINIMQARLHYLQNNQTRARELITMQASDFSDLSLDGQVDKAKALHEVGLRTQALELLEQIQAQLSANCVEDQNQLSQQALFAKYVSVEKATKESILWGPKELNEQGVAAYKNGNFDKAFEIFVQALNITPKNTSIALNLLQVVVKLKLSKWMEDFSAIIHRCVDTIEQQRMTIDQQHKYSKLKQALAV